MPISLQELSAHFTNHIRGEEDRTMRNRALLFEMQRKNRFLFGQGGDGFDENIDFRDSEGGGGPIADGQQPIFAVSDDNRKLTWSYVQYQYGRRLNKGILDRNKGPTQIINLLDSHTQHISRNTMNAISADFFIDATGANANRYGGFETMLTAHGSNTGAGGRTRDPNDTYAGQSTVLGALGGSWTGDWPYGTGTSEYDCHSPLLVNTTNTVWGSSPTFAKFGEEQLRHGITMAASGKNKIDMVLMTAEALESLCNLYSNTQRVLVDATPKDLAVGFTLYNFQGAMLTEDFDVPADTMYGFNFEQLKYVGVLSQLIEVQPPTKLQDGSGVIFGTWQHGQLKLKPRRFVKWYAYG